VLRAVEAAQDAGATLLSDARAAVDGVPHTAELLFGEPAAEIVRRATELEADLLVVGTQKRNLLDRVLFGSVSERILRQAVGPVLIVPHGSVPAEGKGNGTSEDERGPAL
jgi:nucleotide-binding universal stress UspA family protein